MKYQISRVSSSKCCAVNSEIFANSVKRHILDAQNSQLRHDLPISVNNRVILLFRGGFTFTKLRICKVSRK